MEVIAMLDPAPSPETAAAIRQELQNREPVGIVRVEIPGVKVNQVLILENPDGTLTGVKLETTERGELCTAGEFLKSELPWLILGLLELAEETARARSPGVVSQVPAPRTGTAGTTSGLDGRDPVARRKGVRL